MKVTLNRTEIKAIRNFINEISMELDGATLPLVDDLKMSKRMYIMSMVKGSATLEINTEAIVEYTEFYRDTLLEVIPLFKNIYNTGVLLGRICARRDKQYDEMNSKWNEDVPETEWEITKVTVEECTEEQMKQELGESTKGAKMTA